MKETVGLPHGWMYLTFKWFKTSKNLLESCRLINNIATGYNKNTKHLGHCGAVALVKCSLCLHHG